MVHVELIVRTGCENGRIRRLLPLCRDAPGIGTLVYQLVA